MVVEKKRGIKTRNTKYSFVVLTHLLVLSNFTSIFTYLFKIHLANDQNHYTCSYYTYSPKWTSSHILILYLVSISTPTVFLNCLLYLRPVSFLLEVDLYKLLPFSIRDYAIREKMNVYILGITKTFCKTCCNKNTFLLQNLRVLLFRFPF